MAFKKNDSVSTRRIVHFQLINKTTGSPVTSGSVDINVFKNNTLSRTTTISAGSNHLSGGLWFFQLTQDDINSDTVSINAIHTDAVPAHISLKTVTNSNEDIYSVATDLVTGVNITRVNGSTVTSVNDFKADISGLSTFGVNGVYDVDNVANIVYASIEEVNGNPVTIDDFNQVGISFSIDGILPVNVVQIASTGISSINDIYTNTSGLSTFNPNTDMVFVATNGLADFSVSSSAVTKIVNGVFGNVIDGSITMDTIMEMLLAFMAGRVVVTDLGSQRQFQFFKRNGSSVSFTITASELDSEEGQRPSTGTIFP